MAWQYGGGVASPKSSLTLRGWLVRIKSDLPDDGSDGESSELPVTWPWGLCRGESAGQSVTADHHRVSDVRSWEPVCHLPPTF